MRQEHSASKHLGSLLALSVLLAVGPAVSCKPASQDDAQRDAKSAAPSPSFVDEQGRDLLGQIVPLTFKDDVTVENALRVFSMFGVKIELDPSITPEMRQQKVKSVTFENTSFRDALTMFCDQNGLRFSIEDKQILVRKK